MKEKIPEMFRLTVCTTYYLLFFINLMVLLLPLQVEGRHPTCNFLLEVERDQAECQRRLSEEEQQAVRNNKGHHNSHKLNFLQQQRKTS